MALHMDELDHIPLFFTSIISISFFLITLPTSISQEVDKHIDCASSYSCGELYNMYYPFWGQNRPSYCGSNKQFELKCEGQQNTSIQTDSQNFRVLRIDPTSYTMTLIREHLAYDQCDSSRLTNNSLSTSFFHYMPNVRNITIFYDCPNNSLSYGNSSFPCKGEAKKRAFYVDRSSTTDVQNCSQGFSVDVQVTQEIGDEGGIEGLNKALSYGFVVNYTADYPKCIGCLRSDGTCGSNDTSQFTCYCSNGTQALDCSQKSNHVNWKRNVAIAASAAVASAATLSIAFYVYIQRKKKKFQAVSSMSSQTQIMSCSPSLEDHEKEGKRFGLRCFTFSELEEATDNFDKARHIGDGAFGTVYLGKLKDGRFVAVKRMNDNNYRGVEQFDNEVEIITGLRHPNLVSIYGYCTSSRSHELVLVYEYVPNGTVADNLYGKKAKPGALPWNIRMNIAIESADALAYLHASDIIHRDVKTHNILLDDHFRVKVADFGLSRLIPNNFTHISTAPQGTPGYVDPEYHEYYHLTDKSDVYSFGVVLIELISSLPAVDITRRRHEINLSTMAINKIRNTALHELVDTTLGFESDSKVRKMINAVAELAFQCLQSSKDVRPSMLEVLDRLKDIQNDGKYKSKPEVLDISEDDATLLKNEPPPTSPDFNVVSTNIPSNSDKFNISVTQNL
ncbi:PREDICTED: LEAF RUST 10 DISEASE-RESISTANCE LOCUS RECEPTOR-LIKE PROTEIN KINASE-like 1.2 isoform X2 [Lupinus angustifolius]|uniref:LEAF RUST 10 DISEASE-RESISTANCE LOCUS RECEPTOR-LIKE PROTEIN KINASE-like 1.2 isoform X2 n=1 Tax=Lupinus angustifolius TaxID=3871 RepID=UPI00092FA84F|nr:PREDICTED: LEAF RUST 10 DISEASE-RESISTANCE LOCUS RECEPTOR-LIKE PROTEIN KINASE-like 1.2 isoform X2 [Lupinus angustifolius]